MPGTVKPRPSHLVIPAAGLGKRMHQVSQQLPKEMLPVMDRPVIQFSVEEGYHAGIRSIAIVINRNKDIIRRYFEDRRFRKTLHPSANDLMEKITSSCTIRFLYQDVPSGEADAISLASDMTGEDPFAVIYPDNVFFPHPGALKTLSDSFESTGKDTVGLKEIRKENSCGVAKTGSLDLEPVSGNSYRVLGIHPKERGMYTGPIGQRLLGCGFYVFNPHIYDYIKRYGQDKREGEFTDEYFLKLLLREKTLLAVRLDGWVFDAGNPAGYKSCLSFASGWARKYPDRSA